MTEDLSQCRILTFSGPSGAGKTTVVDALMCRYPELERVISCTTRPRRESDPLGEYAYLSDTEFEDYAKAGAFLWMASYAGQRYGTLSRSVDEAVQAKYPRIMTLVPEKTAILHGLYPNRVISFLVTASENTIRRRLLERGDSIDQIEKRLEQNRKWEESKAYASIPLIRITNEWDGMAIESTDKVIAKLKSCAIIA